MNERTLEQAFKAYLESELDKQVGWTLSEALAKARLEDKGSALARYLEKGSHWEFLREGDFAGHRRFLGPQLPKNPKVGDLWFDTVELTPMLLVPFKHKSSQKPDWVALHPIYVWQFRAFAQIVKWQWHREPYENDVFELKRFESMNAVSYISNLYSEEAECYVRWFGKDLLAELALERTKDYVSSSLFSKILPPQLTLWGRFPDGEGEFARRGDNQITLERRKDFYRTLYDREKLQELGSLEQLSSDSRRVYREWERGTNIGASSMANAGFDLTHPIEIMQDYDEFVWHDNYIKLDNCAPRSASEVENK